MLLTTSTVGAVAQRNSAIAHPAMDGSMGSTTTTTTSTATNTTRTTPIATDLPASKPAFVVAEPKRSPKRSRDGDLEEDGERPAKIRRRSFTNPMEPPVLSFYGERPVPLPKRFGQLKRKLIAGHEDAIEASWARLLAALRDEVKHIESQGTALIPSIDFDDIERPEKVAPFREHLKRYGVGVVRGVVAESTTQSWVKETKEYLETKHEFRPPSAQDPTCYDFFWTPGQVRARAHPNMLRAQKFAMSLWDTDVDDRLAARFPITYADRIRIDAGTSRVLDGLGTTAASDDTMPPPNSSPIIAQVDNGGLERFELDGYGRNGCYEAIWDGDWESYNPWDPSGRVNAATDLYNGAGCCSMFRMFQGILALTKVEPGLIQLLPAPKLCTAYFLLRPFFSPKKEAPEEREKSKEWDAYLDPSNWTLDKEQSTIIHGAVPGHAQRVTELWHPHLSLGSSLIALPTLGPGDYILWHPDEPYAFETSPPGNTIMAYIPAAPLTQTNALFLARQRKAFYRGHPAPDFDAAAGTVISEALNSGRFDEKAIAEEGGEEGLRAMGLAPWDIKNSAVDTSKTATPTDGEDDEVEDSSKSSATRISAAEAEVVRMANIILFPDRYDWMPSRTATPAPGTIDGKRKD